MLILTPNPCLDLIFWVKKLSVGSVHRASKNESSAGGKGVNVARASAALDTPAHLILMLPIELGDIYKEKLKKEKLKVSYFDIKGEVRKAIITNQHSSSDITVVNGLGPEITANDWDGYCELVIENVSKGELVLLMGSMPNNSPGDAIDRLISQLHNAGAKVLVDTSPASFNSRKNQIIDFITPNLEEAEALIAGADGTIFELNHNNIQERSLAAAKKLQSTVAEHVFITAGEYGCAFDNGEESWFLPAFKIDQSRYKSAVGAGDSFVAGIANYLHINADQPNWKECVKFGMATAAASCESYLAGGVEKSRVAEILKGGK
jgi:1-phosphofructokinase family hexose kinase